MSDQLRLVLDSDYLEYSKRELLEELKFLNIKEQSSKFSRAAKQSVFRDKAVINIIMEMYEYYEGQGFHMSDITVRQMIETESGRSIAFLKGSVGSQMAKGASEYLEDGLEATKKGLNKFGSWLANKTEGGVK